MELPSPKYDEFLKNLGLLVYVTSRLELTIETEIINLVGARLIAMTENFIAGEKFNGLLSILNSLIHFLADGEDSDEAKLFIADFKKLRSQIDGINQKRNTYIHSTWTTHDFSRSGYDGIFRSKTFRRDKLGIVYDGEFFNINELKLFIDEVVRLERMINIFFSKHQNFIFKMEKIKIHKPYIELYKKRVKFVGE